MTAGSNTLAAGFAGSGLKSLLPPGGKGFHPNENVHSDAYERKAGTTSSINSCSPS